LIFYNINIILLHNNQLSMTATKMGSRGLLLYTGLTVPNQIFNSHILVELSKNFQVSSTCNFSVQAALVICGLSICYFSYMQSRNGLFYGTYPQMYGYPWSFYMKICYMRAYFWSPYLSHITRFTSLLCLYFLAK